MIMNVSKEMREALYIKEQVHKAEHKVNRQNLLSKGE